MVLLSGQQKFFIDDIVFDLDATRAPQAFMMRLSRPAQLKYDVARGNPYRKVALAMPVEWLEQLADRDSPLVTHLDQPQDLIKHLTWSPDAQIVQLATQILAPPPQNSAAQTELFRMSRGLELLRRSLMVVPQTVTKPIRDPHPISERIRLYVLENLDGDLSLPKIETDLGMNRRSLQRHFKNGTGNTLSDFIRSHRLTRAHRALSEDGVSISEAAYHAGYASAENFSVAFQQAFGLQPQQLRNGSF
jgi:AraC-like DNA-binding protein